MRKKETKNRIVSYTILGGCFESGIFTHFVEYFAYKTYVFFLFVQGSISCKLSPSPLYSIYIDTILKNSLKTNENKVFFLLEIWIITSHICEYDENYIGT